MLGRACSKYDSIVNEEPITSRGEYRTVTTICRKPCDEDCKRRGVLADVPTRVCVKAKSEFFAESCYCRKYAGEAKRKNKPKPFQFSEGLSTPSAEDRVFYGHKKLAGKGFV